MAALYLISTYQCGKLLQESKDSVKRFLSKKLIDYVRDDENIYRISLASVLEFAAKNNHPYDAQYLATLRTKISPWYEIPGVKPPQVKTPTTGRPVKNPGGVNYVFKSFGFSKRAMNVFKENGIQTIDQLTSYTAADLMRLHNFGRKTLKETKAILSEHKLSLKKYNPQENSRNQG